MWDGVRIGLFECFGILADVSWDDFHVLVFFYRSVIARMVLIFLWMISVWSDVGERVLFRCIGCDHVSGVCDI